MAGFNLIDRGRFCLIADNLPGPARSRASRGWICIRRTLRPGCWGTSSNRQSATHPRAVTALDSGVLRQTTFRRRPRATLLGQDVPADRDQIAEVPIQRTGDREDREIDTTLVLTLTPDSLDAHLDRSVRHRFLVQVMSEMRLSDVGGPLLVNDWQVVLGPHGVVVSRTCQWAQPSAPRRAAAVLPDPFPDLLGRAREVTAVFDGLRTES